MTRYRFAAALLLISAVLAGGCGGSNDAPKGEPPPAPPKTVPPVTPAGDEVSAERAKLDPADRALVEAQEWCVISTDERLGSMGAPIKLDIAPIMKTNIAIVPARRRSSIQKIVPT